jgi:hypothetical protein
MRFFLVFAILLTGCHATSLQRPSDDERRNAIKNWDELQDAFTRHDRASIDEIIGKPIWFVAEIHRSSPQTTVTARGVGSEDIWHSLRVEAVAAVAAHDDARIKSATRSLVVYGESLSPVPCVIRLTTSQARDILSYHAFSSSLDVCGILRRVGSVTKQIEIEPVYFGGMLSM